MQAKRIEIMFQKETNTGVNNNNRPRPACSNAMYTDMSTSMSSNIAVPAFIESDGGITFTPTTLTTLENTLSNLSQDITESFGTTNFNQRGSESCDLWTDPSGDYTGDDDDGDDSDESCSNSAADWPRIKSEIPSCVPGTIDGGCVVEQRPARKLPGPRPARSIDNMTPLEAERRRRRRERNKTAAARCRQRRVELTNELLAETESLERDTTKLEREIEKLRRQKTQLEFVLDAHMPTCRVGGVMLPVIKQEGQENVTGGGGGGGATQSVNQFTSNYANRPTSLPIPNTSNPAHMKNPVAAAAGSYDANASGWTPVFSSSDLGSPSTYLMLSPTTLLGK